MINNPVHNGNLRDEGDDLHPAPALGADHRVNLIDLPDHGRPTFGRKTPELLLNDRSEKAILPLETVFIFGQEPLEMMRQHPVENGPLRMSAAKKKAAEVMMRSLSDWRGSSSKIFRSVFVISESGTKT